MSSLRAILNEPNPPFPHEVASPSSCHQASRWNNSEYWTLPATTHLEGPLYGDFALLSYPPGSSSLCDDRYSVSSKQFGTMFSGNTSGNQLATNRGYERRGESFYIPPLLEPASILYHCPESYPVVASSETVALGCFHLQPTPSQVRLSLFSAASLS